MKRIEPVDFSSLVIFCCLFAVTVLPISNLVADEDPDSAYQLGPDSMRQEGVPEGKVELHEWQSQIFEGTTREYSVYIPEQYDGLAPAAVMIFQDGHSYVSKTGSVRAPIVFDNLIHRKEMPVTIGIFVNPGHEGTEQPENRWKGSNRSFEYDTLSDQYAKFLHDELLPHVVEQYKLNISSDPSDVAICGASSGGICAFTAAWQHPEWFGKVLSHIGSFTNIRGGDAYPALIKEASAKPIRVFLQDGENDLQNKYGNWWEANLAMKEALTSQGYDLRFVPGKGRHSQKHGGAIFPDSIRWLFRDHVIQNINDDGTVKTVEDSEVEVEAVYQTMTLPMEADEFKDQAFRYRLMAPANVEEGKTYPLVLFLHGAGERGDDNVSQLKYLPTSLASPALQQRFPCYVLAPQCYKDSKWVEVDWSQQESHTAPDEPGVMMQMVLKALDKTVAENQIDTDRIYLTGLSMGGYGSWDLASRRPAAFAAVAPICGGADNSRVPLLKDVPLFVVHGDADNAVPVERSQLAVKAVQEVDGNVIYMEMPGIGHNSWSPGYADHDGLLPWMFRQKLSTSEISKKPASVEEE
ncbi:MAG: alpha/beta hydrolase-fold protein [Fuerstiella sp.]